MKTELTTEAKARFFAQYYGQKIYNRIGWPGLLVNAPVIGLEEQFKLYQSPENTHPDAEKTKTYLLLKPLSSITDEDAIEVSNVYKSNVRGYSTIGAAGVPREEFVRAGLEFCKRLDGNYWNNFANIYNMLAAFDLLRSKGYALPFMGLSVDEMVQAGWIKLSEKGDKGNG